MRIYPVNREWIHKNFLEPYLQGAEMVNRAMLGVDLNNISSTPVRLSLKERVITWLTGVCLLIPFVNTIIWLTWQTFGKPEKLFDRYCPEIEPTPPPPPVVVLHRIEKASRAARLAPNKELLPLELFNYSSTDKTSTAVLNLTLENDPDLTTAKEKFGDASTESYYSPEGKLLQFQYQHAGKDFRIWSDEKKLQIMINQAEKDSVNETVELTEDLPWIQQPELGLKNFVLSDQSEITFYTVVPQRIAFRGTLLEKGIAKKTNIEELPGFGKSVKVEVVSARDYWPYNRWKLELWFDAKGGRLIKMIDPGLFFKGGGEFARTDLSPGSAHP